jgi:eukaryotic-like serine/threonine-protein kinase
VAARSLSAAPEPSTKRLALPLHAGWQLEVQRAVPAAGVTSTLAVSPDGRYVALLARPAGGELVVLVQNLETGGVQALTGTAGASSIFWSPDSRFVAFVANGALKRIALDGGPATTICDVSGPLLGGTWGADDTIVFAAYQVSGLKRVSADGGVARDAMAPSALPGEVQAMPWFLPDGRHLLYTAVPITEVGAPPSVYVQEIGSRDRVKLLDVTAQNVQYAGGRLLYVQDGTLMAQPFDPMRRVLSGDAVPVATPLQQLGRLWPDAVFSASQAGVLVYQSGAAPGNSWQLALVDRAGKRLSVVGGPAAYRDVALAPDARQAAAIIGDAAWTIDLRRAVPTRLTTDPGSYTGLAWSPDGSGIALSANTRAGRSLVLKRVSGAATEERLLSSDDAFRIPAHWSRDGRFLLFVHGQGPFSNNDVWVLPRHGTRKPYPLLTTSFNEVRPRFSPNGRWVAYTSNETGRSEVYVIRFAEEQSGSVAGKVLETGRQVRVSTTGGTSPRWRADGRELFYVVPESGAIMGVSVDGRGEEFLVGAAQPLFTIAAPDPARAAPYDVAPDGQRFLVTVMDNGATPAPPPTVVLNWTRSLPLPAAR